MSNQYPTFTPDSTSTLSAGQQKYYDALMLYWVKNVIVLEDFAQKRPLPKSRGQSIVFTRYTPLPLVTSAATEGTTPTATNLTQSNVSTTVQEFVGWLAMSSLVTATNVDPELKEKIPLLAEQMRSSLEYQRISELSQNLTAQLVSTATNVSSIAASDKITMVDVRKLVRNIGNNKGVPFDDGYWALALDDSQIYDIEGDNTWVNSGIYKDNERLYNGEVGKWFGCKVIRTTLPWTFTVGSAGFATYVSGGNGHTGIFLGKHAFGETEIEGYNKTLIIKNPNDGDTSNPANMFSTAAWKAPYACKTLNANFGYALQTGATA